MNESLDPPSALTFTIHGSYGGIERPPAAITAVGTTLTDLAAWAGSRAAERSFEFLTANISNKNTRIAYHRAIARFMRWCATQRLALTSIRSPHVALYINELGDTLAPLSVKVQLAAIKHWFDFLVTGHVLETNPAHAVRGARYSQTTGKTPVLEREQVKALLHSIDATTALGARDRALISVMLFSFARIGAVVQMKVHDYRGAGTSSASFTLHEKGGKFHRVHAHHQAAAYVDVYLALSGLHAQPDAPLWQSARGHGAKFSGRAITARDALRIVKRHCKAIGLPADINNHSFRATGITLHQDAGGDLEAARQIAGHTSVKTTQLYNRSGDRIRRSEVERVQL